MRTLILIALLAVPCPLLAQRHSVAKVHCPGGSSGSCVLISQDTESNDGYIGMAATAYHVVADDDGNLLADLVVEYEGGSKSTAVILSTNKKFDLAIIRVWSPKSAKPAEINPACCRGKVVAMGYPFGKYGEEKGEWLRAVEYWAMCDMLVHPGHSGGGLFQDGKLVGIISGGWLWLRDGREPCTWPTRGGSTSMLQEMIASLQAKPRKIAQ